MRAQPLLVVRDVEASSRFYQQLLGCKSAHGGREYERLADPKLHHSEYGSDGLILQLHAWDVAHHHGNIGDPALPIGNGVLVWFEIDDFDAAVGRARALHAPVVLEVHRNPPEGDGGPNHREFWIKDPDGYTVVIASPDGECQV
ncbi:MAG: VOC family protein [Bryobacterales bacterium]|nr:VOC family protein [Bryobacterales bacterium]